MRDFLEYYAIKSVLLFTKLFPASFVYSFCNIIAALFFKYDKRRSVLTLKNLHLIYPEKSDEEVLALAKDAYRNVSMTVAEILLMLTDRFDMSAMIENAEEAIEKLKKYAQNSNMGTIMLTAHFSNWELAAHFVAQNGFPMLVIARRGNNLLIEKNLTTPLREKYGNKNLFKDHAGGGIIKCLKNNQRVGLLVDQKASGASSIKVKFFNQESDTVNSIAILKLKYNPTILPVFAVRQKNGKYQILIKEPVDYVAEEESDEKIRVAKMTQKYNDIMEEVIRAYPEQWFWMHNRWRIGK